MRLIYIAGPYSAPTAWQRECNVRAAESQCLKLWRVGVPAVCVHAIARHFCGEVSEENAVAIDDAIQSRCDAVLLVQGWEQSPGTRREIEIAKELGQQIFSPDQVADCIAWATDDEVE